MSDLLGTYGGGILRRDLTAEEEIGLVLNLDRQQRRKAIALWCAIGLAMDTKSLDASWAEAMTLNEEEAEAVRQRINADRMQARVTSGGD